VPADSAETRRAPGDLRLVSWNVHDLLDDRDAVAHVLRSCRADVVCLQEAPRRPLTARRTSRLALETGLRLLCGGRGSGGTAVLAHPRLDVVAAEAHRLPVAGWFTRTRGFAAARVALPDGGAVTVASLHLPLRPAERVDHVQRVLGRLPELGGPPYAVAGDLNEPPGGPAWTALGHLVRDAVGTSSTAVSTYPARAPRHRIDAVLVSDAVLVRSVRTAGEADGLPAADLVAASDHLPLVVDLTVVRPG